MSLEQIKAVRNDKFDEVGCGVSQQIISQICTNIFGMKSATFDFAGIVREVDTRT